MRPEKNEDKLDLYCRTNMAIIKKMQYISLHIWPRKAELHQNGWTAFRLSLARSQPAGQARGGSSGFGGGGRWEGLGATAPSISSPSVLVRMKSALICLCPSGETSSKAEQTDTYDGLCTMKGTQLA